MVPALRRDVGAKCGEVTVVVQVAEFTRRRLDGFVSGLYRPIVDRVLAVEQIVEAHEALESNATFGKVVLRFS